MKTSAFGGWAEWASDLCWANEGGKSNSLELGPRPPRRGCQLIGSGDSEGGVLRLFLGVLGKLQAGIHWRYWNKLPLLRRRRIAVEKLTGIRKSLSLFLPVHSPFNIPYWQSLAGNQLAKQKCGWQFSHPGTTKWNFKKARFKTEWQ